jgi:hypothetical protein
MHLVMCVMYVQAIPYLTWRAVAMPANMFLLVAGGAFRGIGMFIHLHI